MDKINEFIDQTNHIYKDEGLSITFSEVDNLYVIYKGKQMLAIFQENRNINLFVKDIDVTLVYLLNLIDFSGEFL